MAKERAIQPDLVSLLDKIASLLGEVRERLIEEEPEEQDSDTDRTD